IEQHDSINEPKMMIQGAVARTYDHPKESSVGGKIKLNGESKNYENVKIVLVDGNGAELSSTMPAKNGTFTIPLDWTKNPASIRVSAPGYGSQTVYFENHESLRDLTVTLYERTQKMGKV